MLCFITAGVSRIIPPQPPAAFVFVSCVIIVCALLSLVLLFGPKLYFVVKHGGVAGAIADDRRLAALEARQRDDERRCVAIANENAALSQEVTDVSGAFLYCTLLHCTVLTHFTHTHTNTLLLIHLHSLFCPFCHNSLTHTHPVFSAPMIGLCPNFSRSLFPRITARSRLIAHMYTVLYSSSVRPGLREETHRERR